MKFSANLGFLWTEFELPEAIYQAAEAGFQAVELHWPYQTPAEKVKRALDDTGLSLLALNTARGRASENGLSALCGREADARAAIDQAIAYARAAGAEAIHVMSGNSKGPEAHAAFLSNLKYARANAPENAMILIEPLNPRDWPGYFLSHSEQAIQILDSLRDPGVKLMFDCYHVSRTEGDILGRLQALLPWIGHIQFASVPDRGPPDQGSFDYAQMFAVLRDLNWRRPLGAEYNPRGPTDQSLGWLQPFIKEA